MEDGLYSLIHLDSIIDNYTQQYTLFKLIISNFSASKHSVVRPITYVISIAQQTQQ